MAPSKKFYPLATAAAEAATTMCNSIQPPPAFVNDTLHAVSIYNTRQKERYLLAACHLPSHLTIDH